MLHLIFILSYYSIVLQLYDAKLSDDELHSILLETDRNGNGEVDWEEYVHILKHSCWF